MRAGQSWGSGLSFSSLKNSLPAGDPPLTPSQTLTEREVLWGLGHPQRRLPCRLSLASPASLWVLTSSRSRLLRQSCLDRKRVPRPVVRETWPGALAYVLCRRC